MAGKKMTKTQIITHFADQFELPKKQAAAIIDEYANLATTQAKKDGEFMMPGIGKLVKAHRKARMGRNPATGEAIKIDAKTVVKMRLTKTLKDAILPPKK